MTTKKVILFSVIGFLVTAIVVAIAVFVVTNKKTDTQPKEMKTYTYSIGELYANVKDSRKILKVNMDIEMLNEKLNERLDNKRPKMTNNILELLRSKDETQLSGDKGQQALRKEILKSIKKVVPSDEILDVYFVEFIIQ
ncbi:flagellar basal body-associated FliL family protein [Crassaminicella profunda]|uniref:flagellar basal body-associated FliL family protein n=1 Tax=Crassaminicella profunda TaxID=1286698 RepID=UPI001CA618F6|nr:flagellar basal body-associated FliL family protein [Crassaminicella profunda]QZY56759.1 flagellar basal body-associated FliL family protein [Crassaminicella profunda]